MTAVRSRIKDENASGISYKNELNQGFIGFPGFFLMATTSPAHHTNCSLNGKSKYFHASGLLRNASLVFSFCMLVAFRPHVRFHKGGM